MSEDLKDLCENCSFTKVCEMNKRKQTLQEKLKTAIEGLETIRNACEMKLPNNGINSCRPEHMFIDSIRNKAEETLEKIKENKKCHI